MRKVIATTDIHILPSKIIDAFLQPHKLKEWWNVEQCLIQPQSGGVYTLIWNVSDAGFKYVSSGIITIYQPGIMLLIEKYIYLNPEHNILGPTTLSIKTEPHDDYTKLIVIQDGYKEGADWDWYFNAVQTAWPQVLQTLKNYLESK